MKNFFPFLFVFALAIFSFSCNSSTSTDDNTAETEQETSETEEVTQEEEAAYDVDFPVYTSFEELRPIFEYSNDTTYIINFWATWCKPCVKELPYFEDLHTDFADDKVRVILVSLDFENQIETKLKNFIEEKELKSDVIAFLDDDYNSWIAEVEEQWDGAIPVTVIYNKEDRKFFMGEVKGYEELTGTIKAML
ncbi:MAG: TlpA disulfide reductase family protein [Bacteroidota bacterium]